MEVLTSGQLSDAGDPKKFVELLYGAWFPGIRYFREEVAEVLWRFELR
jgi:hypothetical protein